MERIGVSVSRMKRTDNFFTLGSQRRAVPNGINWSLALIIHNAVCSINSVGKTVKMHQSLGYVSPVQLEQQYDGAGLGCP